MKSFSAAFFVIVFGCIFSFPGHLSAEHSLDYLPGRIIVKFESTGGRAGVKPHGAKQSGQSSGHFAADGSDLRQLELFMQSYGLQAITPVFDSQALPEVQKLRQERPQISDEAIEFAGDLLRTYTVTFTSGDDPALLAAEIEQLPGIIYAEPHYTHQTATLTTPANETYMPNDPFIGMAGHNYFDYLNIFQAWGVNRGSPDVVIAIIDTGVYYDHPDLSGNLWRNPEPGRADTLFPEFEIKNDTIGWNFWEAGDIYKGEAPVQNADPVGNFSTHGTLVAGIAAAVTDNATGIAGVGFRSRFMPVKVGGTRLYPNRLAFGYHGILYAAINGADVINCSFIGAGKSSFGTDVIRFAVEMGAVVVAAIGNNGVSTSGTYPASYDEVISVGAVSDNFDDKLTRFSNYGPTVDVFAVGERVMSTTFDYDDSMGSWTPDYSTSSGTSLSAPIVSGLAALLKAEFPDWPALRIASQIRGTARSIYHANPGPDHANLLGQGVIDAHAAITEDISVINITGYDVFNDEHQKIGLGETGIIRIGGIHFGSDSPEVFFEIESVHPEITIHSDQKTRRGLESGETFEIDFPLSVKDNIRFESVPAFKLSWSIEDQEDRIYQGTRTFEYEGLLYGNMDQNKLTMSVPSDGTIGLIHFENRPVGYGFIPDGHENILSEAGLMISGYRDGIPAIINHVRDSTDITRHFRPVTNFRHLSRPGIRDAQAGYAVFHSTDHPFARELEIELQAIAINTPGIDRTVLLNYHITNNSEYVYSDLHIGLFNNWQLFESGMHEVHFAEEHNLMYISHEGGPPYAGIAVAGELSGALAIDNQSAMSLSRAESRLDSLRFGIYYDSDEEQMDGFTDEEKKLSLTAGTLRSSLSAPDISTVTAAGPYTLYPDARISVGFIYAWELNPARLKSQIQSALNQEFLEHNPPGGYSRTGIVADVLTLHPNYPNPFNNRTHIRFDLMEADHVELAVYDLLGRRVATLVNGYRQEGPHFVSFDATGLASGTYMTVLVTGGQTKWDVMLLMK